MGTGKVGTVNDLALSTLPDHVYLGIFEGGRVRMTAAEARATAQLLLDLADVVDPPELGDDDATP